jgi:hypothetical protein
MQSSELVTTAHVYTGASLLVQRRSARSIFGYGDAVRIQAGKIVTSGHVTAVASLLCLLERG